MTFYLIDFYDSLTFNYFVFNKCVHLTTIIEKKTYVIHLKIWSIWFYHVLCTNSLSKRIVHEKENNNISYCKLMLHNKWILQLICLWIEETMIYKLTQISISIKMEVNYVLEPWWELELIFKSLHTPSR